MDKSKFVNPKIPYRGEVKPENLVFNANLQEFANEIGYICNLQTGGKITPSEAYERIYVLWKKLKKSKKELGIDNTEI